MRVKGQRHIDAEPLKVSKDRDVFDSGNATAEFVRRVRAQQKGEQSTFSSRLNDCHRLTPLKQYSIAPATYADDGFTSAANPFRISESSYALRTRRKISYFVLPFWEMA